MVMCIKGETGELCQDWCCLKEQCLERINYKMKCPECGYEYQIELFGRNDIESCPVCGHKDEFHVFQAGTPIATDL